MGLINKAIIKQSALQMAFIAISSRIVGSAFRCLETLNPNYQQSKVISDPRTVCIRELSTISMAWCFALATNKLITPFAEKRNWGNFRVQFLTSVIGTTIAESIGRLIAYHKASVKPLTPPPQAVRFAPVQSTPAGAYVPTLPIVPPNQMGVFASPRPLTFRAYGLQPFI
jgi:hypothetical protein